jgi:hypothetical protein
MLETKTKSQIDEDTITSALTFDLQNQFYIIACDCIKIPIRGVLYNIIRKPGLKKSESETTLQYSERIAKDISLRPTHYFKRFEVTYPIESINLFRDELLAQLIELRMFLDGKLKLFKNPTACLGRGACGFLGACAQGNMVGYAQTRKLFRELE